MHTYAYINQKGGVGKTTGAIHHAAALAKKYPDARVALYDSDPNGTALRWANLRQTELPFAVFGAAMDNLHRQFATLTRGYDFAVIDGPANMTRFNGSIIMCADTVIVPIKPAGFDTWSADDLYTVYEGLKGDSERKICAVLTMVIRNTVLTRTVRDALEAGPMHVLKSQIHNAVAFAECASTGLTVDEINPRSTATREINAVISEIMEFAK